MDSVGPPHSPEAAGQTCIQRTRVTPTGLSGQALTRAGGVVEVGRLGLTLRTARRTNRCTGASRATVTAYRNGVWTQIWSSAGKHTLKIVPTATEIEWHTVMQR